MNLTTIPYWLLPSILLFPALLWMFLGVGVPWALAALPRTDWRSPVAVIAVALALGPALTTTGMFVIGTFSHFTAGGVLIASVLIAVVGLMFALRNRSRQSIGLSTSPRPITTLDGVLVALLILAILLRFWNAAYWPYTTYDEFWVYGYNAKILMLRGAIPSTMGYYPQLLPLAYTYGQLMWGSLNDHAARVVVPVFALASALMAYLLGARLFNRRVGLLVATIWMLYPQHIAWSQFGDLEVPVTMYFTGTLAFFALAWKTGNRRYLVVSGLLMGAALWTKPTAGALIESAALILILAAARWLYTTRPPPLAETLRGLWSVKAVQYPLVALIAAAPMGGMWYIRNAFFGLEPLVFPQGYWQSAAQRSGQELGWPLLIALALTAAVLIRRPCRTVILAAAGGMALMLLGSLPSAFGWHVPASGDLGQLLIGGLPAAIAPTRLNILEIAVFVVGAGLLAWAALPWWRRLDSRQIVLIVLVFIGPYFVTWFWSYSYHYRLSFAIVPAMILLLAALLDDLLERLITASSSPGQRRLRLLASGAIFGALALPGLAAAVIALEPAITATLPNDHARMARGNASLMHLVDYLTDRRDPNRYPMRLDRPMRVEAPGELRLPFFFPLDDIRTIDYPVGVDQIADVDFFVDSSVGQRLYLENGKWDNQILASLTRNDVMQRLYTIDDGNFRFSIYAVNNQVRFRTPKPNGPLQTQIGDFAFLSGYDLSTLQNSPGNAVYLTLWWQALRPADLNYSVYVHLWDAQKQQLVGSWGGEPVSGAWSVWNNVPGEHFDVAYHTRLWQPGETIKDEWRMEMPQAPPGVYELRVGLYDPVSGKRLPVTGGLDDVNGGDFVRLPDFTILPSKK